MIQAFCLEVLHRLPREVDAPFTELQESMIAWSILRERQKKEQD